MPKTIIVAEVGINHNSDLSIAKRLIDVCAFSGIDYVKFQKRTPDLCVPDDQKSIMRDTPWGRMSYIDYRYKMEFGKKEYDEISCYCKAHGIKWTASAWDVQSIAFMREYQPDFIKVPSALITNVNFLKCINYPTILSTGMSDIGMVDSAVDAVGMENVKGILHCISTYPAKTEELNLDCIRTLKGYYPWASVGYSNHHPGVIYIPVAVALGAEVVEFHITLDRSMWGTDQAASIEPEGAIKIVKYIRGVEVALGDGVKRIYESEIPIMRKLRK